VCCSIGIRNGYNQLQLVTDFQSCQTRGQGRKEFFNGESSGAERNEDTHLHQDTTPVTITLPHHHRQVFPVNSNLGGQKKKRKGVPHTFN
jgi:hypothetical protein